MFKMPVAPHPLDQCTSTELKKFIEELLKYLDSKPAQTNQDIARANLGRAYAAYNVLVGTGAAPSLPGVQKLS